jgi:hypothetical protein
MACVKRVLSAVLLALGCASPILGCASAEPPPPAPVKLPPPKKTVVPADAQVKFKGNDVYAGRREAMVQIPGVSKNDLIWAPDGIHFAYAQEVREKKTWRIFVKNTAGDPMNEFDTYRPGQPHELEWIDDRILAYIAPPEKKEVVQVYAIHDAQTGEVVAVRRGKMFRWSPGKKKRLAYVAGKTPKEAVQVDGRSVWPRSRGTTQIHGEVSWSPNGHGLAFIELSKAGGRLVVMLELDDTGGDLTWPLPPEAMAPGLHVFWAGDSKVVIGETNLKPKFAANWERLQ